MPAWWVETTYHPEHIGVGSVQILPDLFLIRRLNSDLVIEKRTIVHSWWSGIRKQIGITHFYVKSIKKLLKFNPTTMLAIRDFLCNMSWSYNSQSVLCMLCLFYIITGVADFNLQTLATFQGSRMDTAKLCSFASVVK